ncbi:O-antigen ligase family protein [Nocardioides sp. cx-169]|uniref:O-antigen ligase family protein n=1 Tax=Nocardioides sp. cx-169 TaxID=2899080 RepID=UPI001E4DEA21|nr:O-antigen ligase family protein [Nocardioides sp. cx-169]MCD4534497.1 O-antigen ligase family protein [Nocardioides sp. cx-169]
MSLAAPPTGRGRPVVVPALTAAVVLGLAAGFAPREALLGLLLLGVVVTLLLRVDWAALVVVGTAVFEDYLTLVDPRAVKGLAALLVCSWLLRRCAGLRHRSDVSPVLVCALVFVGVLLAATVLHANGRTGLDILLRYAGFLAVLAVLTDCMRGGLAPARVARVYVVSCTLASVCGVLVYILGGDRRVGGPIEDPNDLAFFLLAALPLAFALRRTARRGWTYDLAAGLVLLALLGTLSRGALVGVAVMLFAALLMGLVRLRLALGFAALLGAGVLVVLAAFPQLVDTSLDQKGHVAGQNISERLDLWQSASAMTLESPVLGLGPGSFSLQHRDYADSLPRDVNHHLSVAHNTYLEISSETGLVGLTAFLAILVAAYAGARSRWRRTGDLLGAAVCVALLGTAAAAAFVTEQYFLPLWLLAALGAGLAPVRGRGA